jgi:hypothetical protein
MAGGMGGARGVVDKEGRAGSSLGLIFEEEGGEWGSGKERGFEASGGCGKTSEGEEAEAGAEGDVGGVVDSGALVGSAADKEEEEEEVGMVVEQQSKEQSKSIGQEDTKAAKEGLREYRPLPCAPLVHHPRSSCSSQVARAGSSAPSPVLLDTPPAPSFPLPRPPQTTKRGKSAGEVGTGTKGGSLRITSIEIPADSAADADSNSYRVNAAVDNYDHMR